MEKKKIPFNLRTVTALLCALVALFSVLAFAVSKPGAQIKYRSEAIKQLKASVENTEKSITEWEKTIESHKQEMSTLQTENAAKYEAWETAKDKADAAEQAYEQAEAALDKVCRRSYYSSYLCSSSCKSLHNNVSTKQAAWTTAKKNVNTCWNAIEDVADRIDDLERTVKNLENRIETGKTRMVETKAELAKQRGKLVGAWFSMIFKILGAILGVGGMGLFARNLYCAEEDKKLWLAACGAVAASALLSLVFTAIGSEIWRSVSILYVLLNPYSYTILIMALFAGVILNKAPKPVVFRTVAIVAAVVGVPVSALAGSLGTVLIAPPFAATMICLAFVIVPLVFTEYIPIAKHIFLSLITFGIWVLVWTYYVTKNLNKVEGVEQRTPRNELLLCMFLAFYYPFWMFKSAEYVEAYGAEKDKKLSIEALTLIFAFVCPLFATVLIQNKINVVANKPE